MISDGVGAKDRFLCVACSPEEPFIEQNGDLKG
jgi:hypothetical protein